jgi:hypothetical protein
MRRRFLCAGFVRGERTLVTANRQSKAAERGCFHKLSPFDTAHVFLLLTELPEYLFGEPRNGLAFYLCRQVSMLPLTKTVLGH